TASSTIPSRISHISECTWRCGGCGVPPGGKVVSCTSNGSPVANLPFSTARNCALFAVRTGKLSNGYLAEGREPCRADGSFTENNAGSSATGKTEHNSRRVRALCLLGISISHLLSMGSD